MSKIDIIKDILFENRRCGATTGHALAVIGRAMVNPDQTFFITEFGGIKDRPLIDLVVNLINQLNLRGFIIDEDRRTIRYELDRYKVYLIEQIAAE